MDSIRAGVSGQGQANLVALSDEFYTVIPHNFGFKKMRDFVLKNEDAVRSKLEMLDSLEEVKYIQSLQSVAPSPPLDRANTDSFVQIIKHLQKIGVLEGRDDLG